MATKPRKKPAPKTPAPLTLKGSKLEDFLPLLPAEEKLRQCAASGEECEVDDFSGERPEVATELNTVRAEFLRYMILGGCEKSPCSTNIIDLKGGFVICPSNSHELYLQSADIKKEIGLFSCKINGSINLLGANIKSLFLKNSYLNALLADRLIASGSIMLSDGFRAESEVRLINAEISGDLDCRAGFFHKKSISLGCDRIVVQGTVFLKDSFEALGRVRFVNAKISGNLDCNSGTFHSGLSAQNATIDENITLSHEFTSLGEINFRNTRIGQNLNCKNAKFDNSDISIIASRAQIGGNADLENVIAKGTIALTGTEIGGDFTPQGASLEGTPSLQLRNSKIGGTLVWRSLKHVNGEVDFSGASCATINTDGDSWMRKRDSYHEKISKNEPALNGAEATEETQTKKIEYNTKLDNFTYSGFSNLPDNCKPEFWIEFLNQQPQDHLEKNFKPRPWEQLAGVLDSMGYQEEALELRIEKQKLHTNFMANHEPVAKNGFNFWHWGQVFFRKAVWGPLVGYGYKPGNALVVLFGIIMLGTLIYSQAAKRGIMTPTHPLIFKEARTGGSIPAWCAENWVYFPDESCTSAMPSEYSEFQSFIYAADVALPVVNLRMEVDWAPRVVFTDGTRDNFGWWVRLYEWFLIAAGWILSLLFVSAVGSSIRK